jgi:hypothetical protein
VDKIITWDQIALGQNSCFIVLVDKIANFITSGQNVWGRDIRGRDLQGRDLHGRDLLTSKNIIALVNGGCVCKTFFFIKIIDRVTTLSRTCERDFVDDIKISWIKILILPIQRWYVILIRYVVRRFFGDSKNHNIKVISVKVDNYFGDFLKIQIAPPQKKEQILTW